MEELKLNEKSSNCDSLSILYYVLSALVPALGFTFKIQKDFLEKAWKKVCYIISIVAGSILLAVIVGLCIATGINKALAFGSFTLRTLLLILLGYGFLNGAIYLWFVFFYFRKEVSAEYSTKLYKVLKAIFVCFTVFCGVGALYTLDEVVTSFPRGIPWESFSWEGGQDFVVAFYAICILTGACISWFTAVNKAHEAGFRRDIFDPIMFVAFPMGIVGARIWYVISCFEEFDSFASMIDIRSGGLAIQGGVILGAFFGMWIMCEFHREMKLRDAMDMIIPGILLAQALGRWGNFFNIEVYGAVTDPAKWWFIPRVVITHIQAYNGSFFVPLFLIEACFNILGYFVITRLFGKLLKKFLVRGDQAFLYFVWYGTVRVIMEPLRNQSFIMGTSSQMSIAFICAGVVCIICNHLWQWYVTREKFLARQKVRYEKYHELAAKFENMAKWKRVLLALPIVDSFAYSYYRFIKGHYYSALLWLLFGWAVCWVIDLGSLLAKDRVVCSKEYV